MHQVDPQTSCRKRLPPLDTLLARRILPHALDNISHKCRNALAAWATAPCPWQYACAKQCAKPCDGCATSCYTRGPCVAQQALSGASACFSPDLCPEFIKAALREGGYTADCLTYASRSALLHAGDSPIAATPAKHLDCSVHLVHCAIRVSQPTPQRRVSYQTPPFLRLPFCNPGRSFSPVLL